MVMSGPLNSVEVDVGLGVIAMREVCLVPAQNIKGRSGLRKDFQTATGYQGS